MTTPGLVTTSARLYRYRLPLVAPLRLAFGRVAEREGLLLRLEAAPGLVAWGEAAPLPGYSPDTLEGAEADLRRLTRLVPGPLERLEASRGALVPSVQAALEAAAYALRAQQRDAPVAALIAEALGTEAAPGVALNALLAGEDVVDQARAARTQGYTAAKLKVGADPAHDARLVQAVADALGAGVALRLDANRRWTLADALRFAEALGDVPLDYIEEPVAHARDLDLFAEQAGLPVALDESLRALRPDAWPRLGFVEAVVLKPMLGQGVSFWTRWQSAVGGSARPVVSAAFESGVGLRYAAAFAAALGRTPAGLDTYRRLAADVYAERLPLTGPFVDIATLESANPSIDERRLERVL